MLYSLVGFVLIYWVFNNKQYIFSWYKKWTEVIAHSHTSFDKTLRHAWMKKRRTVVDNHKLTNHTERANEKCYSVILIQHITRERMRGIIPSRHVIFSLFISRHKLHFHETSQTFAGKSFVNLKKSCENLRKSFVNFRQSFENLWKSFEILRKSFENLRKLANTKNGFQQLLWRFRNLQSFKNFL